MGGGAGTGSAQLFLGPGLGQTTWGPAERIKDFSTTVWLLPALSPSGLLAPCLSVLDEELEVPGLRGRGRARGAQSVEETPRRGQRPLTPWVTRRLDTEALTLQTSWSLTLGAPDSRP